MRTTNRNRPDHRGTALRLISLGLIGLAVFLLLAAPAAADDAAAGTPAGNTAVYTVAEDGKSFTADIYLTDLDTFPIVAEGLFWGLGGDAELKGITDMVLTDTDTGEVVTPKAVNGVLTFPKGNYHLTFTAPIEGGLFGGNSLYLKYPAKFDVTVYIPNPYTTGHLVLGKINEGGVVSYTDSGTVVTYTGIEKTTVPFYDKSREMLLYVFAGIWVLVLVIAVARYRSLRKRQMLKKKDF